MSLINLSDIPQQMRPIAHFVKIANEYATRDVVIQYWCLLKALEDGMKVSGNDPNAKKILLDLMTALENMKQSHKDNDAIMQEIVAQSHIEDQAQRLFQFAYGLDQNSQFGQKTIKAFYTAGYLFDVLTCFGQLDENIQSARKYAKWRAIDIHNCLKNGEQPKPAAGNQPTGQAEKDVADQDDIAAQINEKLSAELNDLNASMTKSPPASQQHYYPMPTHPSQQRQIPSSNYGQNGAVDDQYSSGHFAGVAPQVGPATHPFQQPQRPPTVGLQDSYRGVPMTGVPPAHGQGYVHSTQQHGAHAAVTQHYHPKSPPGRQTASKDTTAHHQPAMELTLDDYLEAKKLAKYAQSAMDYEDPKTAIDYLQKAIAVLQKKQQQ